MTPLYQEEEQLRTRSATVEEAAKPREDGFTKVPNLLLHDTRLSIPARLTYAMVASYAYGKKDHCFPGQETLAEHLGVHVRKVRNYLNELVDAGYIEKVRQGQGLTNLYYINDKPSTNGSDRPHTTHQDARFSGSNVSDRPLGTHLDRPHTAHLDRPHTAYEEDKGNKTSLRKQVVITTKDFSHNLPVAGISSASSTEGGNGDDGFDWEDYEDILEAIEMHEEEAEEFGDDDVFFPGDSLNSIERFLSEDGAPRRLARGVIEGNNFRGDQITVEHVAEAIAASQDPEAEGIEMTLAKLLVEAVSRQLEGASV